MNQLAKGTQSESTEFAAMPGSEFSNAQFLKAMNLFTAHSCPPVENCAVALNHTRFFPMPRRSFRLRLFRLLWRLSFKSVEEAETLCVRIGIIDHGQLLAEGTLPELQKRLGGDQLFVLEGDLQQAKPDDWPEFHERFRIIQKLDRQLVVSAHNSRHPSECLRDLLELPVRVENVTLKRPSLNDVFLQLTGRELRE